MWWEFPSVMTAITMNTPGYGSAVRFIAASAEVGHDEWPCPSMCASWRPWDNVLTRIMVVYRVSHWQTQTLWGFAHSGYLPMAPFAGIPGVEDVKCLLMKGRRGCQRGLK